MPAWSNNDVANSKPKWDTERQTREVIQLTTANSTSIGSNVITFVYNDGAGNNVANLGVTVGQSVATANIGANGYSGFFTSNNSVASIKGNNVTFVNNVFGVVPSGATVEFDNSISWNAKKPNFGGTAYNANTVLVTPTRLANNSVSMGNIVPGWVNIIKTANSDGTVRYRNETLVVLANPAASNTNSGQTGWGTAFTGV